MTVETDTAPQPVATDEPMPGFADAMTALGMGNPGDAGSGHPEEAQAVDTAATVEAPEERSDTPAAKTPKAPEAPEATPAPAKAVNFDGFSDKQKATWERLLKAGHATPEEVEDARKDSLRQDYFSKRTAEINRKEEALAKKDKDNEADLALLKKIRDDERLHAAWLKASKGELPVEEADGGDLVDAKKAAEIAKKTYDERRAEEAARTVEQQAAYDAKENAIRGAAHEQMRLLGIDPTTMGGYLKAEEARLNGADPILHYGANPRELMERVALRHEAATAKAEAATLREQLNQRTSKQVQTSKQSLPPARRVVERVDDSPLSKTNAELGLDPDWGNVTGFGFPGA